MDAPPAPPEAAAGDGLRERTVAATAWSLGAQAAIRALNFAVVVLLARLLAPEDFGLLAMTAVVTGFAAILSDVGFGPALIQRPRIEETHRSSVFWLSLAIGVTLMLVVAAVSPIVAWFFKEPILVALTLVVSLDFLLVSLAVVPLALMRRALRFKPIVIVDLGAMVAGGACAVASAALGAGVWSLAVWTLTMSAVRVTGLWSTCDWRPRRIWDRRAIGELFHFGRNLLGFNIVNYWIRNADKLLVGRFLAAAALGLYTRAYALLLMPLGLLVHALGNVMFPAMASIQHDKARVARVYLRTTRAVSLATFPLMAGLFVVAGDFVPALFGSQWVGMVPLVRLFCVAGILESIGALNGNLFLSQGRSDLQFRVGAIVGVLSVAAMVVGLNWGLIGVATAYTLYAVLAAYPQMSIAVGLIGLTVRDVARGLAGTLGCALIMAVLVWGLGRTLPDGWPQAWSLLIQVTFGVLVYGSLVVALRIQAWLDVYGVVRSHIAAGTAPTAAA